MSDKEEEAPEDIPSFRWIVAGCTGSGKTHLVRWLLRELPEDELSELIVISASAAPKDWPETTPSRVYDDWDPLRLKRQIKRPGHKLFIIDDFLGLIRPDEPALVYLFTAGRHHGASVILITQRLNGFSPAIRVNASRIYLCRTIAAKELDVLYDEVATSTMRKRADWYKFVEESTRHHNVLLIQMVYEGKDGDPFSVVKPPAELADHFVEPEYESDEEDREVPKSRDYTTLTKPLPASNRRWKFKNAETPQKKTRAPRPKRRRARRRYTDGSR